MALPYETLPGDVDRAISDDHAAIERIFQHLEAKRGDRRTLADQLIYQLSLHTTAAELAVYPDLAGAAADGRGLTDRIRAEHQRIQECLASIDRNNPGSPDFEEALDRLIAEMRKHVPEEERESLPALRDAVGPRRMAELGAAFADAKRRAPTRPHPSATGAPPVTRAFGAPAAMVDKVRDRTSGRQNKLATDASGLLEPQAQQVLDAYSSLNPKPIETLEPQRARKQPTPADAVSRVLADTGRPTDPEPVGSVEDITIPRPSGDIALRVYRPTPPVSARNMPIVIYFHGGGFVIGDLDSYDSTPRGLANREQCIVVSVEYRHAPEHPFPAAHDDALEATRWIYDHAADLGGDPDRIAIAGESAGGNLAASTCLQLRAEGGWLPAFQLLVYPMVTGTIDNESCADSADARPLSRAALSWYAKHTFSTPEAAKDPRFDVLNAPADRLRGLPPTLVITAERDPLRTQGQRYADRLIQAGVEVECRHYEGVPHEFFGMAPVLDAARDAQQHAANALHAVFTESHATGGRAG
ncbi:Acetyl esterase/lipase [Micromonospora pattaloongensis]|uniref:Acetyl esterase/lipase n=1 Tax=Micromonospora pattaloongensis TaxID=405436 RepID=A0A1H3SEG2_9ACTN|nr:alpha/beta hydrolase fold domain-containing protein [Micromonospora pattaloongensis]SDZ36463.1 Acetyl esterase/lipase [Micromonospora pattaloongensis]